MNLRTTGLLLLSAMLLTGLVARDFFKFNISEWVSITLGVLGVIALGVYHYQQRTFKKFGLMLSVYALIFVVLVVIQLTNTP